MSKTKEEILDPFIYQNVGAFGEAVTPDGAEKAMQEYADQEVEKAKIYLSKTAEALGESDAEISEQKAENERLREELRLEHNDYLEKRSLLEGSTNQLALIRPLAFADHSSVEYNMEEIRKILNNVK